MESYLGLTIFILDTNSLANSEDRDEMTQNVAFRWSLHCLLR